MPKTRIYIIIMAIFCAAVFCKTSSTSECQNVNGQIALWNGWPPCIRIESNDKKYVYGIETNDKGIPDSDFMPDTLWKKLLSDDSLSGTFCIKLTGGQTTVPYDERVIKYVKIVRYKVINKWGK